MHRALPLVALLIAVLFAFSQAAPTVGAQQLALTPVVKPCDGPCHGGKHPLPPPLSKIAHVIIIIQENRTPDNLFQGLPGADIANSGYNSKGQKVTLMARPLADRFDLDHSHTAFVTEYNGGKMNGWDHVKVRCHKPCSPTAFGYVPRSQIMPYWEMATHYTFADRMFQDNQGPSFPAHQYLIAGTSLYEVGSNLKAAENPHYEGLGKGWVLSGPNCDGKPKSYVTMIDPSGNENVNKFPCFQHPTLMDLLAAKGVSWRYYNPTPKGFWSAPDAIRHLRFGPAWKNVVAPETQIITDISKGDLQQVSWVVPTCPESDHPECNDGKGPSYVASIVDALGKSKYWGTTAIFITWDDWGGWFDHVKPMVYNSYEMGFRVPLIVVSPYAKRGYVSHAVHQHASILRFVEKNWGLGTMGYADSRADDLSDCFNFFAAPGKFVMIDGELTTAQLAHGPINGPTDDDF